MLTILLYTSLITGGILIFLLSLSFISGLDLDMDIGHVDVDAGGMGIVKGLLVFLSIGSYVVRSILMSDQNPILAFSIGILAGGIAVFLLTLLMNWLLKQQSNVNWSLQDTLYEKGKVYLKIPKTGTGIVHVNVNGATREIRAKSTDDQEIPTGEQVMVEGIEGNILIVSAKFE